MIVACTEDHQLISTEPLELSDDATYDTTREISSTTYTADLEFSGFANERQFTGISPQLL